MMDKKTRTKIGEALDKIDGVLCDILTSLETHSDTVRDFVNDINEQLDTIEEILNKEEHGKNSNS